MTLSTKKSLSPWAPLAIPIFRMLWLATVVSNIGTWMESVGESWLMITLTHQPILIALVQSATSLPVFFLALPAGALADILDRRLYLIILQIGMAVTAGCLAMITYLHVMTPYILLSLTFMIGILTALFMPTWQSIILELVDETLLPPAIALNSIAMNISRVVGPALAGLIITWSGPAAVFALNAISFLGTILVLTKWRRQPTVNGLPSERLYGAMRAGVRYVRQSPEFHRILLRITLFFLFSSVVLALLPLIVRRSFQLGPSYFGILLGCLGLGAVICVFLLPRLRQRFTNSQIIFGGKLAFSVTIFIFSWGYSYLLACLGMVLGGMGWLAVLATLNTMAQLSVASWVRARALAIYNSAFFGGMALGSLMWGIIASHSTLNMTFLIAGTGLLSSAVLTRRLGHTENIDHTPAAFIPPPEVGNDKYDQGPVMVLIEYKIAKTDLAKFSELMKKMRRIRLRENSFFWNLFIPAEKPELFVECFMVDSWLEHLRQHERASLDAKKLREQIYAYHQGTSPPKITHYLPYRHDQKIVNTQTSLYP